MTIRVAINGYGRIGRNVLRALYESEKAYPIKIVAINDLGDASINAHLTKYDSVHGRFNAKVEHDAEAIYVNGDKILTFQERDPGKLPWNELQVDVVFECTGIFTSKESVQPHLAA
ncbi:MAG: glyceraldehyde 3-phosphate dehydrogenase NAD-binding domain-containing protein, partial [Shewanella sp.]